MVLISLKKIQKMFEKCRIIELRIIRIILFVEKITFIGAISTIKSNLATKHRSRPYSNNEIFYETFIMHNLLQQFCRNVYKYILKVISIQMIPLAALIEKNKN